METKEYFFQKLTPKDDADISVYDEAINFVFENNDITNVAISGAYSAGKSSVIESYKNKHRELNFVHISLAHFRNPDEEEVNIVRESVLEGKILNQLIHQISVEKIPQTNFRVKKETSKKGIIFMTAILSLLLGSVTYLLLFGTMSSFVGNLSDGIIKDLLSVFTGNYTAVIVAAIAVISSITCIFNLIKIQVNKNLFHRISIQGNEIEIFESQEDSYFDKYLNEVLYLFEQVEADAIVFEDMDRFNANSIFERLREVNNLTNIQRRNKVRGKKKNTQYKPLRFLYLLRDDIFITKDRTKFFDYIIPIVPVLDGSNAYEQFMKHLKQGNIFDNFDDVFLQRLSLYIDDMRVLKNVYNEFVVYMHRLDNTDLNWNKMLAMIVYKNLFPRDFSNLQLAKGYVHELFEQKDKLAIETLNKLRERESEIKETINRINEETLIDVQEIDDAYEAKYKRLPQHPHYYNRLSEEGEKQKNKLELEKNERKRGIEINKEGRVLEYEEKLTKTQYEISVTKTKLLSELITRENSDEVFLINSINPVGEEEEYKEIKSSDYFELLKFLIRDGYIDETYTDYMTYFYEESLTANDKTFLRRITDKRGAEYEYKLKEVQKVLASSALRIVDFSEEETLNFDLLNGLLERQGVTKYQEYLRTLINQIQSSKNIDFISKYYDTEKNSIMFIQKLNEQWTELFSYIVNNKAMSSEQIKRYSLDTLYCSDKQVIEQVNAEKCLSDYISSQADYLAIESPNVDKIREQLEVLQVSFKSIDYESSNKDLFNMIYEESLYDLTFENVELMLRKQYNVTDSYSIQHRNYTLVQSKGNSPLASYIDFNLGIYLDEILQHCNGQVEDDEDMTLSIINDVSLDDEHKIQYIKALITRISDVISIENVELWIPAIQNDIVILSVSNAVNYFKSYGMSNELVNFINKMDESISFEEVNETFESELVNKFFDSVAFNNTIKTNEYIKILKDLKYVYNSFSAEEIDSDKICLLIKNKIIKMTEENLLLIRKNYPDQIMYVIQHNLGKYLEIMTSDIFSYEEALKILDMDLEDEKKLQLIGFTSKPISVLHKKYTDVLLEYILTNNFDDNDKNYLFENYSDYQGKVRETIYQIAIAQVNDIIDDEIILDDQLLSEVIVKSSLAIDVKIKLWSLAIPRLNEEICKKHFDELGLPELKGIFTKRNSTKTYDKNQSVKSILEALKKNTWIYDFYVSQDDNEKYIVKKNPPKR